MSFVKCFESLKLALDSALKNNVNLSNKIDSDKAILDYKMNQKKYYHERFDKALKSLKDYSFQLHSIKHDDELMQDRMNQIIELVSNLDAFDVNILQKQIKKMDLLIPQVKFPTEKDRFVQIPKNIPHDIKADVVLDLEEMDKCYENSCYRSCVILCGRVLETVLHRKYFEATGFDILEKNPGIGLGNLIAKLKDKGVLTDPALTNQVHVINQTRIFSVHKKKEPFNPSQPQTQAMILYTMDVIDKLFNSR
jgi:hypothetical protein